MTDLDVTPMEFGDLEDLTVAPPLPGAALPTGPMPSPRWHLVNPLRWKRRARVGAGVVVGLVVSTLLYDAVLSGMVYEERQRHLSADFSEAHPVVRSGDAVAVLQIPEIDLDLTVVEDDTRDNLRGAPAHRSGTALPGAAGTSVILGHRSAYGGPFERLAELGTGTAIAVKTKAAVAFQYTVTYVGPSPPPEVLETNGDDALLVLVSGGGGLMGSGASYVVAEGVAAIVGEPTAVVIDSAPSDAGSPFNADVLAALAASLASVFVWLLVRDRTRGPVLAMILAPSIAYAVLRFAMALDVVLPALR